MGEGVQTVQTGNEIPIKRWQLQNNGDDGVVWPMSRQHIIDTASISRLF